MSGRSAAFPFVALPVGSFLGELVVDCNARLVKKGDENYPYAVSSLLQSQYGYLVDQQL